MPDVPTAVPGALPVRFDPSAAAALASALDNLAWRLETVIRAEDAAFTHAVREWRGPAAGWAALERQDVRERTGRAAGRCRDAATAARRSVTTAALAQESRNRAELARGARAEAQLHLSEVKDR